MLFSESVSETISWNQNEANLFRALSKMAPYVPEEVDVFTVPHSRMKELVNDYFQRVSHSFERYLKIILTENQYCQCSVLCVNWKWVNRRDKLHLKPSGCLHQFETHVDLTQCSEHCGKQLFSSCYDHVVMLLDRVLDEDNSIIEMHIPWIKYFIIRFWNF